MIPDRKKSIAAMRTYARDLEHDRGDSPTTDSTTPIKPAEKVIPQIPKPSPKMAAAKATSNHVEHTNVPEHIPAFHELKKDKPIKEEKIIETPKKKEKKSKGITTNTPKGGGTIITDTKHERRPFFKEVAESLSSWFSNFKKSFKRAKKKTYTVTETTRRKGVVQKATSKTGTIFSADNETLMNEIRKRQRAEKSSAEDGKEEVLWSPYTESGYPLLDGNVQKPVAPKAPERPQVVAPVVPQVQNVVVQPRKRVLPEPVATKPTTEAPPLIDEEVVKALEQQPIAAPKAPTPVETYPQEEMPIEEVEQPEEEVVEITEEEPEYREPFINGPWWKPSSFFHHNTNKLTVVVFGALLLVVVSVVSVISIFGNIPNEAPVQTVTERKPISSTAASLQTVKLSNTSYNELSSKLNAAMLASSPGVLTEFIFVNEQDVMVAPITLSTIVDLREGDTFAQTLTEFRALKNTDGSRAIIFKVDDNLNARGGLLDWELFMYEDSALMLDMKYKDEPQATFYDVTIGKNDVRILKDGDDILLVYGFIDEKTVVITSSLDAFVAVTEL